MKFKGDIIITDPCYIFRVGDWDKYCEDFDHSFIKDLGFTDYLWEDTVFGDGIWTVFDTDNKNSKLGSIAADTGLMGVFLLREVMHYLGIEIHSSNMETIIRDFDGDIQYVSKESGFAFIGKGSHNFIAGDIEND